MAVTEVQASLAIYGMTTDFSAAAVTRVLGITPTYSHELGDANPSSSRAPQPRPAWKSSTWIWEEEGTVASDSDSHGMLSLDRLAERFEPLADALARLSNNYTIKVSMIGWSDSERGGFYIDPETMRRLGRLSAAFVPTIYVRRDDDD